MLGLATPFKTQNYGTKLQAYAMQSIFTEMGYDTEIINFTYTSSKKDKLATLLSPKKLAAKIKYKKSQKGTAGNAEYSKCMAQRNAGFDNFVNQNLRITRNFLSLAALKEYSKRYDAVICGSDQIWLPVHIQQQYYTLSFVPKGTRRIAYAPSFGINSVEKADESLYKSAINGFDSLSCREMSGCDIIKSLTNKEAQLVLDPTLMVDKKIWDKMSGSTPKVDGEYIFCYFLGKNPEHRKKVRKLAEKTGLKVVCLPYIDGYTESDNGYADLALYDIAPDGFVNLIKNAKYVCTDSFHGSVFSTIFERQYFVFERFAQGTKGSTNTRLESLLKSLGLEYRQIKDSELADEWDGKLNKTIDYTQVQARLEKLKAHSAEYITAALDGILPAHEKHIKLYDKHDCCGCSACADKCPVKAISMKPDSEGFVYANVDESACIGCGACIKACPIKQFKKGTAEFSAVAAYSKDENIRHESTSGGIFTHLAKAIISNGGVVIGAAFDENFGVRHIAVDNIDDLKKFRSSKYVQSNTQGIYKETKALLDNKKTVLFSGTPCQIRALKSFLGKDYENLITVDLFCHGAPSPKIWNKYLEFANANNEHIDSVSFRDKRISWENYSLTIKYKDHEKSAFWKDDAFARGFGFSLFNRPACSTCRLKSFPRISDITLGDLWLIQQIFPDLDDHKGISFVLLNNEKGKKLFDNIKSEIFFRDIPKEKLRLTYPVMGTPTKAHPNREAFFNRLDTVPFDELVFKYATVDKKREFKIKRNKVLSKLGILPVLKRLKKML